MCFHASMEIQGFLCEYQVQCVFLRVSKPFSCEFLFSSSRVKRVCDSLKSMRVWWSQSYASMFVLVLCECGFVNSLASFSQNRSKRVWLNSVMRVCLSSLHASMVKFHASFVQLLLLQVLSHEARKPRSPCLVTDPSSFIE